MSGGIRANWHLAALRVPEGESDDDPFAMTEIGTVIDLTASEAKLHERLASLCRGEARLWEQGVRCDLKQEQEQSCQECAHFTADPNTPLSSLCYIGREQENVTRQLQSVRTIENEFEELAERAGVLEAVELADVFGVTEAADMAEVLCGGSRT